MWSNVVPTYLNPCETIPHYHQAVTGEKTTGDGKLCEMACMSSEDV